jgi:hypothetical protein
MSNRPAVKSAFEGLRPSIVREPSRSVIKPQDESKLLQTTVYPPPDQAQEQAKDSESDFRNKPSSAFPGATLLTKKRREVLVPVTFRIPQSLKEQLNDVARKHELNQTDLINEGIELNLQRYR